MEQRMKCSINIMMHLFKAKVTGVQEQPIDSHKAALFL